jgi:hypothetical protein
MGVLFSASLSEDTDWFLSFTPSNDVSREYNVYETYIGPYPQDTYWTFWGGWYDNPIANQLEIYIGGHTLIRVDSLEDCCEEENSLFDIPTAGIVYINVSKHTWLYDEVTTNYRKIISFLSGPKNQNNPSDNVFYNEQWPIKLETPKFSVKLSDVINGLTKYSTFDFTLYNEDGYFDDLEATNFFNSPSYIRKTWKENPTADDFISIRYGMVETIKINDKTMIVSCADLFRTLEEPVCKIVKDIFPTATENTDENLPVVYGTVTIPLIEISTLQYVAGENITALINVYDKDGIIIENPDFTDGVITVTREAEYAMVTGSINNKIGEIVKNIIETKTNIRYMETFWDISETDEYINNSPEINIAFTDGTVRDAIKDTLLSDMVFLIQKNDGRFTLREWGKLYSVFTMKDWEITKFPTKNYSDAQKNYLSSCSIKYNYNFFDDVYNNTLLYNNDEDKAEEKYSKLVRKEFETCLTNETDAFNLGAELSYRFSTLKETIQIGVGHDTSEINLLDFIKLELNINRRLFSKNTEWIVKEIDPAQDILTLETIVFPPPPPPPPPGPVNIFVAIAGGSDIAAYSTDGINWSETNMPSDVDWKSITFGNGIFVAVASNSNIAAYSTDGINWSETNMPSDVDWKNVAFGNGIFVAIASNSNIAARSTDGINWIQATLPTNANWQSIVFGNGISVIVAGYSETVPSKYDWKSITFGNGIFVAIASNDIANYSTDGTGLTITALPESPDLASWINVTYGNEIFVAINNNSDIAAYSIDSGISWIETNMPNNDYWYCVTYGNGKFVAVANNSDKSAYSLDGINWLETNMPNNYWTSVAFGTIIN